MLALIVYQSNYENLRTFKVKNRKTNKEELEDDLKAAEAKVKAEAAAAATYKDVKPAPEDAAKAQKIAAKIGIRPENIISITDTTTTVDKKGNTVRYMENPSKFAKLLN